MGNFQTLLRIGGLGFFIVIAVIPVVAALPGKLWVPVVMFAIWLPMMIVVYTSWHRQRLQAIVRLDLASALNSLIRQGADIMDEAHMAGIVVERSVGESRDMDSDVTRLRAEEAEWVAAVENLLAGHSDLQCFTDAFVMPSTGAGAISNRVGARVAVLREIREKEVSA